MPSPSQESSSGRNRHSAVDKLDRALALAILAAVLVILVWGPLAYGAVHTSIENGEAPHLYGFLVIQGLVALTLVLWAARIYLQRPFRLLWPPVCWAVSAFVLYAAVRCQFVTVAYIAKWEWMEVALYAALFFVIVNNLNRRQSALAVSAVLIAVGVGESLFALYQFASHNPHVWAVLKPAKYALRASGTYINPDNFAGFAEMALPLALAFTVVGRLSATVKVLTGYGSLVMLAAILASESRGGVLAAVIALTVFCLVLLFQREYWRQGAVALTLLALAGAVLFTFFGSVGSRFENLIVKHGDERVLYWNGAIQIFRQHLWWGAGPGHYRYLYPPYARFEGLYGDLAPLTAHNDYLNTLCEWGLAGFALILLVLGLLYVGVRQTWPYVKRTSNELERKNSSKTAFVLGASIGLLAIVVHSFVDFNMHIPANAITAITLMALLTAHWRFATEGYWVNPRKLGKALLAVLLLGAAACLVAMGTRAGREFYWLRRANTEKVSAVMQVAAFQKAYAIEPLNYFPLYELGEIRRAVAFEGNPGYEDQTRQAMTLYQAAMILNPYDAMSHVRYAMCLDWLDRHQEATPYFLRANELRPYNSTVCLQMGRHCMALGNYPLAASWFRYSLIFAHGGEAEAYYQAALDRIQKAARGVPQP